MSQTTDPEARLREMGLELPEYGGPGGNYVPVRRDGSMLYLAGQGPRRPDGSRYTGKVGAGVSVEEAYEHARLTALGMLSVAKSAVGDLARIEVLKVFGMINAAPDFGEHAQVMNGCSDLLVEVLGEKGRHARSAVGMGSLPGGWTIEIEAIFRETD